ncbi:hypothetical protein [uncultured Thalassospira sp.]|uniref:hypothetical protein n=1 Tax=uncultured Thalassospira sp. TaxID=404382 RepID=UPI0030DABF0D|tara:strand:+ start:36763 stop:37386 length:624 start_codon:yes stop_codon:yes gene_type:complete
MITYPLTLPARPGVQSIRWKNQTAVARTRSPFTFQSQVQVFQGQAWAADITLPKLRNRAHAAEWAAFFLSLNGSEGNFLMGPKDYFGPRGVATGSPVVDGAGQLGAALETSGWTAGVTGILKAGDYIGLGSEASSRMYRVLVDADSDEDGKAMLLLWPRLTASPATLAPIEIETPQSVFYVSGNIPEMESVRTGVENITFSAVEVLA